MDNNSAISIYMHPKVVGPMCTDGDIGKSASVERAIEACTTQKPGRGNVASNGIVRFPP